MSRGEILFGLEELTIILVDSKILSRWPESNIGLPFSSLEYASSFSWDHSLQIERIIMFAV